MGKWNFAEKYGKGKLVAGVDEAGCGSLIGDIYACAVIWDENQPKIKGINDSKKLSPEKREKLYKLITKRCLDFAIGIAHLEEVIKLKAYKAAALARYRAVKNLKVQPEIVIIDAFSMPEIDIPSVGIIKGDTKCSEIMMASIIAKVERDRYVDELDKEFPVYDWKSNRGYYCRKHITEIIKNGACKYHRTYLPTVQKALWQRQRLIKLGLLEEFKKIPYKENLRYLKKYNLI